MKRRLIVLGPPAGGKGTHGERMAAELGVPHIATGDMLRLEVVEGSELGANAKSYMDAGELVPDELISAMMVERLGRPDASTGWVLDGFPRDLEQAHELDSGLVGPGVDVVIALEVGRAEIIGRVDGRRVCPNGHVYHVTNHPPGVPGVCDEDGATLSQRDDDRADVVAHRLDVYEAESQPLLEFYEERGVLAQIDGSGIPDDVYARVVAALARR